MFIYKRQNCNKYCTAYKETLKFVNLSQICT